MDQALAAPVDHEVVIVAAALAELLVVLADAGAEPQVPFGGFKGSSSGTREQGKAAREFFTQTKTVYLDPP